MEEMLPPENPMGTAKISGLVLKTGLPLMISLLINSLYNFVDSVFVARISEEALTALSLAAPIQIIMSAMGLGIAVGLNAVISRALGEKNQDRVKKTASAALVLAFLAWVLVVMLELTVMKPYFRWQSGGDETIMGYGIPYLRICMLGSLGMLGQWVFDRFVMASGLIPIVAYNYGAKKSERIYQSCRWAMLYSVMLYGVFFLIMEIVPEQVLLLFDASEEMLAIGVAALRIMAVSYLLSNVCLTFSSAFQGLGMGVQSMLLTLSRQVIMPVLLIAAASWFGELSLIWWAFVLAEALVIPAGMILWKKESGKSLGALTVMCSE